MKTVTRTTILIFLASWSTAIVRAGTLRSTSFVEPGAQQQEKQQPSSRPRNNLRSRRRNQDNVSSSSSNNNSFTCMLPEFLGRCTAPDPTNSVDECSDIGELCVDGNPGEYCCLDLCGRKYCTAKGYHPENAPLTQASMMYDDDDDNTVVDVMQMVLTTSPATVAASTETASTDATTETSTIPSEEDESQAIAAASTEMSSTDATRVTSAIPPEEDDNVNDFAQPHLPDNTTDVIDITMSAINGTSALLLTEGSNEPLPVDEFDDQTFLPDNTTDVIGDTMSAINGTSSLLLTEGSIDPSPVPTYDGNSDISQEEEEDDDDDDHFVLSLFDDGFVFPDEPTNLVPVGVDKESRNSVINLEEQGGFNLTMPTETTEFVSMEVPQSQIVLQDGEGHIVGDGEVNDEDDQTGELV